MNAHPPVDPDLVPALAMATSVVPSSITPDLIALVREATALGRPSDEYLAADEAVDYTTESFVTEDGTKRKVLVLRPHGTVGERLPVLFHVHGGGMVAGDERSGLNYLRDLVVRVGFVAVSVDYRLAPEHPHPTPLSDCAAALKWVVDVGDEHHWDVDRLVLIGASAGGGIAAGLALHCRDQGGPRLSGQILICPMLDDRARLTSSVELVGEGVWDRISNRTGWAALLGEESVGGRDVSPYAAAARAVELTGLPPTFLDVGSVETFRDEVVEYASRLWSDQVEAQLHVWPGGFHGFDWTAPDASLSKRAKQARVDWLTRLARDW